MKWNHSTLNSIFLGFSEFCEEELQTTKYDLPNTIMKIGGYKKEMGNIVQKKGNRLVLFL